MRGDIEASFLEKGHYPAGVDEVGRGCLAGPVYAACVILDYKKLMSVDDKSKALIRDSKTLSHKQRELIVPLIKEIAIDFKISFATAREIEKINILQASFLAMSRAAQACTMDYDILLVDGNKEIPTYKAPQMAIIKGDDHCYNIAAASILAKEARDSFMAKAAVKYPEYGFEAHVGYATKKHIDMVNAHGICELHRRTFGPIRKLLEK